MDALTSWQVGNQHIHVPERPEFKAEEGLPAHPQADTQTKAAPPEARTL